MDRGTRRAYALPCFAWRPVFPLNELRHAGIVLSLLGALLTGWLASDDAGWFTRVLTVAVVVLVAWGTLAALGTFRSTDGDGRLQALGSAIVLAFIGWPLWWAGERLAATGHPILAGIVWVALALYGFELAVRLLIFVLRLALPGRA